MGISGTQAKWLSLALRIAGSTDNSWKHAAVLVKGGRMICSAPNIYKNDPHLFQVIYPEPENSAVKKEAIRTHCSIHAEARVVKQAGEKARGSIVYVARVDDNGNSMLSKPCDGCYKTMTEAGVKSVIYTS